MILFHAPLGACLHSSFFKLSFMTSLFSVLSLFFGPAYLVFVGWTSCIAYPLFLNTADAIKVVEW